MDLKIVSIGVGILAGTAGIANSGYGLYQNVVVKPAQNAEHNREILGQTPLMVETIEIHPDPQMAMRVEVTVKIFPSGDILVESGNRRQFIPFLLGRDQVVLNALLPSAYAADRLAAAGTGYSVETIGYIEQNEAVGKDRIRRVRIFADGTVESSMINIRANEVVETRTEKRALSEAERQAIRDSPYKKKIFTPNR